MFGNELEKGFWTEFLMSNVHGVAVTFARVFTRSLLARVSLLNGDLLSKNSMNAGRIFHRHVTKICQAMGRCVVRHGRYIDVSKQMGNYSDRLFRFLTEEVNHARRPSLKSQKSGIPLQFAYNINANHTVATNVGPLAFVVLLTYIWDRLGKG